MFVNLCKINSCRKRAIFFFVTYNKCDLLTSWYFWVDVICNVGMVKGSLLLLSLVNKGFSHLGERKGMLKVLEGGRFNLKNFCVCMEKCERRGSGLKHEKQQSSLFMNDLWEQTYIYEQVNTKNLRLKSGMRYRTRRSFFRKYMDFLVISLVHANNVSVFTLQFHANVLITPQAEATMFSLQA